MLATGGADGRVRLFDSRARARRSSRAACRYEEAYVQESLAFVDCLINNKPSPCSGEDGLIALIMSIAAGKSAEEGRWVKFTEIAQTVVCDAEGCQVVDLFENKEDELAAAEKLDAEGWEKVATSKLD